MKYLIFILIFLSMTFTCYGQSIGGSTNVMGNTEYTYTFNSKYGGLAPLGTPCVVTVKKGGLTSSKSIMLGVGKTSVSFKVKWDNISDKGSVHVSTVPVDASKGEIAWLYVNITKDNTCYPTSINGQNITSNKNYSGCAIEIVNTNISNNAVVDISGEEYVLIKSSFKAAYGTDVTIRAGGALRSTLSSEVVNLPKSARLEQNIPNPFSSTTKISYYIPEEAKSAYLHIVDYTGKRVTRIDVREKGSGYIILERQKYEPNVIYLYSLIIDDRIVETKKFYVK
ncbi:MAG: hypothetical protein E6772_15185 [Dysgonomonas sp.]|nr:hypothetical protein [Dysgonomonas sp.]